MPVKDVIDTDQDKASKNNVEFNIRELRQDEVIIEFLDYETDSAASTDDDDDVLGVKNMANDQVYIFLPVSSKSQYLCNLGFSSGGAEEVKTG